MSSDHPMKGSVWLNWKFVVGFYTGLLSFLFIIGYWVYKKIQEVDALPELEEFTLEDLEKFNGVDNYDLKTYISVRGRVFDITDHPLFKPGEKYNALTGHEASIVSLLALAKGVVEEKYIDSLDLNLLNHQESKYLSKHFSYFSEDYEVVGHCKEWIDKHGLELPKPKNKTNRRLGEDTRKNTSQIDELAMLEKVEVETKVTTPRKVREQMERRELEEEREREEEEEMKTLKNRKKKNKKKK
eukprot:gene12775-7049_t